MIGEKSATVRQQLGTPLPNSEARYNADAGLTFSDNAYKIEVGFIADVACYVIYVKEDGSKLQGLEVKSLLASEAYASVWQSTVVDPNTIDFTYQEQQDKGMITRVLFAELQAAGIQLVIYSQAWRPILKDLAANPLT